MDKNLFRYICLDLLLVVNPEASVPRICPLFCLLDGLELLATIRSVRMRSVAGTGRGDNRGLVASVVGNKHH